MSDHCPKGKRDDVGVALLDLLLVLANITVSTKYRWTEQNYRKKPETFFYWPEMTQIDLEKSFSRLGKNLEKVLNDTEKTPKPFFTSQK